MMTYDELVDQCQSAITDTGLLEGDEARDIARAIIPIVQEACAGVADRHFDGLKDANAYQAAGGAIAQAIRNMGAGS